jgi:hypothetical protein
MMTLKVLVTGAVIRIGAKSIQDTFSEIFYDLITLSIRENIMKKSLAVQVNRLNTLTPVT